MIAPLLVRLKNARTDRYITREVRALRFRSSVPGGFESCSFNIDRSIALDPNELRQYTDVFIYDRRSVETAWQGTLEDPGRGVGSDGQTWHATAVGPRERTKDRTVSLFYVDRSHERWAKSAFSNAQTWEYRRGERDNTDQDPTLELVVPRGITVTTGGVSDRGAWRYRAIKDAGQYIARLFTNHDEGITDADWLVRAALRLDGGAHTNEEQEGASTTAGTFDVNLGDEWAGATDYNFAELVCDVDGTSETIADENHWIQFWDTVVRAVLMNASGAHITTGYTLNTVLASEVVNDLLGRLLTKYDGANASVATTSFAIEQLAFPDGITAFDVLENLMLFHADHYWAAWEWTANQKYRFEWRAWPTTVRYEASARDGFEAPNSAAELFNAVTVRWRDSGGRIRMTTRTQTVTELTDAGLTRTAFIDLGDEVSSSANADRVGDQFLAEHASAPNAGTLIVRRPITDNDTGRKVGPHLIRPGHLIRVRDVLPRIDALNVSARDAVTVFRVVAVDYDADEHTARLELDSRPRHSTQILRPQKETRRR